MWDIGHYTYVETIESNIRKMVRIGHISSDVAYKVLSSNNFVFWIRIGGKSHYYLHTSFYSGLGQSLIWESPVKDIFLYMFGYSDHLSLFNDWRWGSLDPVLV